jgi:hypothetical protein
MKFFFNCTAVLTLALLLIFQIVNGQESINPAKNLSVSLSSDTLLLFKELVSDKLLFKLPVKKGSASHYLKFSPSGNFLITSGTGPVTDLYIVEKDTVILSDSFQVLTEESVFNRSEKELFLLHSKSLFKTRLTSYSTASCEKLADANVPYQAHDLSINASGSLLGFCESNSIYTFQVPSLKKDKIYWQRTPQRLLTFNPAVPDQAASVSKENHIQIRDIKKDTVLAEINAHRSKIVWLGYDPKGELLVSLDNQGNLFTWMLSLKQAIAQFENVGGRPVFGPNGTLNLSSKGKGEHPELVKHKKTMHPDSLKMQQYFLETAARSHEIFKLPIVSYSPETGMLVGLGYKMIFNPKPEIGQKRLVRPSVVTPMIAYSSKNKQFEAALETDIYAIKGWQLHTDFHYGIHEMNYYFGIGDHSSRLNKQPYVSNSLRLNGNMLKIFGSAISAGLAFSIRHDTPLEFEKATDQNLAGINGGWTIGVGPAFQVNSRNNTLFPTRGAFLMRHFTGMAQRRQEAINTMKLNWITENTFHQTRWLKEVCLRFRRCLMGPGEVLCRFTNYPI